MRDDYTVLVINMSYSNQLMYSFGEKGGKEALFMQLGAGNSAFDVGRTCCRKRKKSLKQRPLSLARYFKIQLPDCAKVSYLHSEYKFLRFCFVAARFCRNVSALLSYKRPRRLFDIGGFLSIRATTHKFLSTKPAI